jgi:hypothetical protein
MSSEDLKNHVEILLAKAANAEKSDDAMRFSQAAANAANALCALGKALNPLHQIP